MTQICAKCNYVRKPTDEAPEWQCPSCQRAYVKSAEEPASANAARPVPVAVNAAASGGKAKWILIAALLGTGVWIVKPSPKHAGIVSVAKAGQPTVILYGTEWCGYCKAAREFFQENGILYADVDVEKSTEGYEAHKKLGGRGVPVVVIGDEVIHGYSEEQMQQLLSPWLKGN